jgi:hypothetical protein
LEEEVGELNEEVKRLRRERGDERERFEIVSRENQDIKSSSREVRRASPNSRNEMRDSGFRDHIREYQTR